MIISALAASDVLTLNQVWKQTAPVRTILSFRIDIRCIYEMPIQHHTSIISAHRLDTTFFPSIFVCLGFQRTWSGWTLDHLSARAEHALSDLILFNNVLCIVRLDFSVHVRCCQLKRYCFFVVCAPTECSFCEAKTIFNRELSLSLRSLRSTDGVVGCW